MSVMVITKAATARLATIAAVRTDLGLTEAAYPDARVERLIDQASAQAATFCRRVFGRQVYRERVDGCAFWTEIELVLSQGPVNRILGITADGVAMSPATYETDGSFVYRLRGLDRVCWSGRRLIVDYEAGWLLPGDQVGSDFTGDTPLPADVEKAVIQMIGMAASEGSRDIAIRQEEVEGVGSFSYYVQGAAATLAHPGAEATLQQYRNLALA